LNTTPTGENTLRSCPSHTGQTVSEESVNDCWMSKLWPQTVHV